MAIHVCVTEAWDNAGHPGKVSVILHGGHRDCSGAKVCTEELEVRQAIGVCVCFILNSMKSHSVFGRILFLSRLPLSLTREGCMNGAGKGGRHWLGVGSGCLSQVAWASWYWKGAEECQGGRRNRRWDQWPTRCGGGERESVG